MKKLALLMAVPLWMASEVLAQAPEHAYRIEAELSAEIRTPTMVNHIQGRRRQTKPTWVLVETGNGDSTLYSGNLRQVSWGKVLSLYEVSDTMFVLPTKHYFMEDSILRTRKGKKIECLLIELEPCACTVEDNLKFGADSITTNANGRYKMIFEMDSINWRPEYDFYVPGIPIETILRADTATTAVYGLAFETTNGVACDIMWLHPEEHLDMVGNKVQLYEVSSSNLKHFGWNGLDRTLRGEKIWHYWLVTSAPDKGAGVKKRKHARRVRRF